MCISPDALWFANVVVVLDVLGGESHSCKKERFASNGRLERDGLTPQRPMGGFVKENANKIDRNDDEVITCEELASTTRRMFERAAGVAC